MIKVGIIGATGYAGAELVRLCLQRDDIEIVWYGSKSYIGEKFSSLYPSLEGIADDVCSDDDLEELSHIADVIFTATPQGFTSAKITKDMLGRCKIIDLSGDYRFKDTATYEKWYGIDHKTPKINDEAQYGLPELGYRDAIKHARIIANPGCFPTCSVLSVLPALKAGYIKPSSIIIDAKSGTSGAGRGARVPNLFCEVNENIKAYGVTTHRHTPEIEEQLTLASGHETMVNFTPHLVPMMRGILVTAYADLCDGADYDKIRKAYDDMYKKEKFVRVLPKDVPAQTRCVKGSNYVDVNFKIDERTHRLIMMGAIDNLIKGAAGQAMQNMNLMMGLPEDTGLEQLPMLL